MCVYICMLLDMLTCTQVGIIFQQKDFRSNQRYIDIKEDEV